MGSSVDDNRSSVTFRASSPRSDRINRFVFTIAAVGCLGIGALLLTGKGDTPIVASFMLVPALFFGFAATTVGSPSEIFADANYVGRSTRLRVFGFNILRRVPRNEVSNMRAQKNSLFPVVHFLRRDGSALFDVPFDNLTPGEYRQLADYLGIDLEGLNE
jgi:hypothetical protein